MKAHTVIFIHGMYMTPLCWENWAGRFRLAGYECLLPAWPGREAPVEDFRNSHPTLGQLRLSDVVDSTARTITMLAEKPILIGHSLGGLVVQLLLQRDLAAAGVVIDSAPPAGVLTLQPPFFISNWPHISPFVPAGRPVHMSFERFQYTFVNGLPLAEQHLAYDRYVVPESRHVPRQALMARVDFSRPHPPLLMIAGSADHLIPAALVRTNYARYGRSPSITSFKEFPGRAHFILGQQGWEEVADYVLDWLDEKIAG